MGNLHKDLEKCKHPNSRKTKALSKKVKRMQNKHRSRLGSAIKYNIAGEKIAWFLNHLGEKKTPLTPTEFQHLIEKYLQRFNDEIEQIKIKQLISKNRNNQHIARENVIKITLEKESNEYNGGGLELINLCDPVKLQSLIDWDGNAINVQHLKFDLISKAFLERLKHGSCGTSRDKPKIIITPSSDEERKPMDSQ